MPLSALRNHKGFFSDYWLGTLAVSRGAAGPRLTPAQSRKALERLRRAVESVNGIEAPPLGDLRERLARPLFEDVLGFSLAENPDEPRLRPLRATDGGSAPAALVWLEPEAEALEAPQPRRKLEEALLASDLDYGFLVTPQILRLIRRPGLGQRGAAFDLNLGTLTETADTDSLAAAYRVLAAETFVPAADGQRPIERLEAESRRHSARVSDDLKQAVFDAAERVVSGFLADVRERTGNFDPAPTLTELRDAGFLSLYRLLFILYAEARDERLIQHGFYQRNYSLDGIVTRLLCVPVESLPANRFGLWAQLQALFRIFNEGIDPHLPELENIPPRGGRLFNEDTPEGCLLRKLRLDDRSTGAVLLALATTRPRRGVGRERVSFRELDIEQLGNVYQGLLEYEPAEAAQTVIECRVAGREYVLVPDDLVRLVEQKHLVVRGELALVEGTMAEHLHPDAADEGDETDDEEDEDDTDDASGDDEDGEGDKGVKRGATLKLLRRLDSGTFYFKPGSARKASGSYYTPTAIVDYLVRESLAPLVAGKTVAKIEKLRVIDLACGSAHFLVGAARFLGHALYEAYRNELGRDPPSAFHPDCAFDAKVRSRWEAEGHEWCKRRIVEHCLYGVDLNPAAVQLAQVALWIESLAGDRPLSFFAHHVRCGNSLLGSSLERFDQPPLPSLGKPNQRHTLGLFEAELKRRLAEALEERRLIDAPLPPEVRPDTPQEYDYKQDRLRRADKATETARLLLDLRSASPLVPAIWQELPQLMGSIDLQIDAESRPWWGEFKAVREREHFFHWELEFPEVLADGGFDCVLGNPPWDKVLPSKLEFYGPYDPLIRAYKGNDLKRRIQELNADHEGLALAFDAYSRRVKTFATMLRAGGDFPLAEARSHAAHEDISKYFVDRSIQLTAAGAVVGLVTPSVFYNGDGWVGIRRYLFAEATIERFYSFENRLKIFPIHSSYKFVNLVARKHDAGAGRFTAAFMRHDLEELKESGPKPWQVEILRNETERLSPDTLALLEYRSARDQEIVRKMYAGKPTLGGSGAGSWGTRLMSWRAHEAVFNSTEDKDLFTNPATGRLWTPESVLGCDPDDAEAIVAMQEHGFWPVYEGKHIDQFLVGVKPIRWWLSAAQAEQKYGRRPREESTLVFRETASNTNERTCIATLLPEHSVGAHTLTGVITTEVEPDAAAVVLNSFCFDYALRLRTAGTHVSFTYILPMPVPPAPVVNRLPRIQTQFADGRFDCLADNEAQWPALWQANRAVAQAYGLDAADLAHILASFPVFGRKRPEFYALLKERVDEWRTEAQREQREETPTRSSPHIHSPRGVERPVANDLDSLADDAWARPRVDQRAETGVELVAILRAMTGRLAARQVRLAALFALEPRLLLPYVNEKEGAHWQRLVGAEADPLPQGSSVFIARHDQAWGAAVRNLRTNGHLIEDVQMGTWEPGENLDRFPPSEWADGRARMVLRVLQRHATDTIANALPDDLRGWVNDVAAA